MPDRPVFIIVFDNQRVVKAAEPCPAGHSAAWMQHINDERLPWGYRVTTDPNLPAVGTILN